MKPVLRHALHGGILVGALLAALIGPAYAQSKPKDSAAEEQQRYEAAKKAKELEAQERAYKSATELIPTKQVPLDPWGNVRPNAATPPKAGR